MNGQLSDEDLAALIGLVSSAAAALRVREHHPAQFATSRADLLDHILTRLDRDTERLPLPTSSGTLDAAEQLVERLRETLGEYEGVGRS